MSDLPSAPSSSDGPVTRSPGHPVTLSSLRQPLVNGDKSLAQVTKDICTPLERRPTKLWWAAFLVALGFLGLGTAAVSYQIATGVGTWGLNKTVGWAFDITNFVFWIGIGHAGTLISAISFLFRQKWRTSVNRSAEAMTLFAVMCAGLFPVIHMGRPWLVYWLIPLTRISAGRCGSTSARRWSGTSSPSPPTSRSPWSSGTSA